MTFYNIWWTCSWVHPCRTQLHLHFHRSLCNTLTWDVLF